MKRDAPIIGVLPMGHMPDLLPQAVAAHVQGYLQWPAEVLEPRALPQSAHDPLRDQFDAGIILAALETNPLNGGSKIIAVMEADLFLPIFTYVFGEARQGGQYALVSIHRLKPAARDTALSRDVVAERTAKVALHELGHLFNLVHCEDPRCLMHFSDDLESLDRLPFLFCRYCRTCFARYEREHAH
jgi:archaemetzincin